MYRYSLIVTGIILFALTTPSFSLTLQEKMDLIRQKELQRKEQIKSEHNKKVASQHAVKVKSAPVKKTTLPVANSKVAEKSERKTIQAAKVSSKAIITTIDDGQVWAFDLKDNRHVHNLLINKVENGKVSAFYIDMQYGKFNLASLLEGELDEEQGTLELTLTNYIKGRLGYQLSGKILNGRLLAEVQTSRGPRQWVFTLDKNGSSQVQEAFDYCRSFYEKIEKQRKIEKHYRELVVTPEVDEYGVKTLETMKLEYEKKFLRPLTEKEIETLEQNRANEVQSAINRKKQQEEQARLAEEKRKQAEVKQARIKAEIAKKEREPLTLFDKFNLADNNIDRDDFKETIIKAGGQFISSEKQELALQMELLRPLINDPEIDVFATSSLLPGTTFGFAHYITTESMFGNDEVLAAFAYMIDPLQSDNLMKKISEKYGQPSEEGKQQNTAYAIWLRDSGKSSIRLEVEAALLPTVMLIYTNVENMKQLELLEKSKSKKQQGNF